MKSAMDVSYAFKNGAVIKIFKKPVPPFRKYFKRIVKRMIKDIVKINFKKCELNIRIGDARKLDFLEDNFFNAIITSPPYLNKIEYTKMYRIEYELFFGHIKVDPIRSYISLNLKNVKDIFPELNLPDIAKAYFYDMKMALNEIYRVLKYNGKVALVVAEGVFPDRIVESDILLAKIAKDIGFKIEKIIIVNERVATRERTIKIGKARESIIILEK
jgi:DNA modification methylase